MTKHFHAYLLCLFAISLFFLSGCNTTVTPELDSHQQLELDPDDIRTILIDPSSMEQLVFITAKSDGAPIKLFVYLSEDSVEVDNALMFGNPSDKILVSQSDTADITLSVKIPAEKEASIRLQTASPEKANVTLVVSN